MEARTAGYAEAMAVEAAGESALELLFVQSSDGGELTGSTLTLGGVNNKTGWFSDRPFREAGQMTTEEFVSLWGEGNDSFAADPPNADFTREVDGEVVNSVVELTHPILEGEDLSYAVAFIDGGPSEGEVVCEGDAYLFINTSGVDCSILYGSNPPRPPRLAPRWPSDAKAATPLREADRKFKAP